MIVRLLRLFFLVGCITNLAHLNAQNIRPCVTLGTCSICRTSSCVNCPKLGTIDSPSENSESTVICRACKNGSSFCDGKGSSPLCVKTAFIPRSQGTNTARELIGWEEFIHQFDVGGYYLTTGHVFSYSRSFRPERIAHELFGRSVLHFSGSQVPDRGACELLADNFGLSPHFVGAVAFDPLIENIIFDNQFFVGLDPLVCGLYVRIHMPLVHTRWNLRMQQTCSVLEDCPPFPACYMSDDEVPAGCDLIRALSGRHAVGEEEAWRFGRILNCVQTKTALADIDLIVGYDLHQTDTSHMGFYGQLVVPTGNRYTGRELFQPIVGNAKHVEIGGGFSGHLIFLERDSDSNLGIYIEGNLVHMVKNNQMRSFDFCGRGPLSRYMLLKEFTETEGQLNFAGTVHGIDVATRSVSVSIAAKADISIKLAARTPHIIADLGYNFFGQTGEKLCLENRTDGRHFGFKGTEGVCGLEYQTISDPLPVSFGPLIRKIPLNSTQSRSTIRQPAQTDNPQTIPVLNPNNLVVTAFSRQEGDIAGLGVIEAFSSQPPVLINGLDLCSGTLPAQATHKVFGYLGYNFFECDWCCNPYLGIGGEAEFDARSKSERSALNQWSVWAKGGFEF